MLVSERIELEVGFIEFLQIGDFADIHDIEVDPEHRGKGYGAKLMELFLNEMKNRNVAKVTLEVRVANVVAIRLYEKFGFGQVSIRKNYYKDGCDALLMRLSLTKLKNQDNIKYSSILS